jgi:hypothetical protein
MKAYMIDSEEAPENIDWDPDPTETAAEGDI